MKTSGIIIFFILLPACVSGNTESKDSCLSVPFKVCFNEILFQSQIGDSKPLWFILDSGASDFVVNESTATRLKIPLGEFIDQGYTGVGENRVYERTIIDVDFRIKNSSVKLNEGIYAWPFNSIESIMGHRIDGVCGRHIFERYIVEIDYKNRIFNLYDPGSYQYSDNKKIIPIDIDGVPYAEATVILPGNRKIKGYFLIDTGAAGAISFTSRFCRENNLPEELERSVMSIHSGGGGNSENRVGRIDAVVIGGYKLDYPIVTISNDTQGGLARQDIDGIIGNGILKNFKVVFDYSKRVLILEKSELYNEPAEWDMSGLLLYAGGENLDLIKVYKVLPDSPAVNAGIREGDQIESIDGISTKSYSIYEISEMFRLENREYDLGILRQGSIFRVKVKMRKMI